MSTSSSLSDSSPLILRAKPVQVMLGGVPTVDGNESARHDQYPVVRDVLEAPRPITIASVRDDVGSGRVPLVMVNPADAGRAFGGIRPGSALAIVPNAHPGSMRVYYEGGVFTRQSDCEPTAKEWFEYARTAASRASEAYPTIAMTMITSWEALTQIGYVDVRKGERLKIHLFAAKEETHYSPAAIAHAAGLPLVHQTKSFIAHRAINRFGVRQGNDCHLYETLEVESLASEKTYRIRHVRSAGRDLEKAIASAEESRHEWLLCEKEERDGFVQDEP